MWKREQWARWREKQPFFVRWARSSPEGRRSLGYYWTRRWSPENGQDFRVLGYAMRFEWRVWRGFQYLELVAAALDK